MMSDLTTPLHGHRGDRRDRPAAPAGGAPAISREAGARGETIARRVGKRLGWQVYTQELLEFHCANEVARQSVLADAPAEAAAWVATQLERIRNERGFDADAEDCEMPRLILALAARGQAI